MKNCSLWCLPQCTYNGWVFAASSHNLKLADHNYELWAQQGLCRAAAFEHVWAPSKQIVSWQNLVWVLGEQAWLDHIMHHQILYITKWLAEVAAYTVMKVMEHQSNGIFQDVDLVSGAIKGFATNGLHPYQDLHHPLNRFFLQATCQQSVGPIQWGIGHCFLNPVTCLSRFFSQSHLLSQLVCWKPRWHEVSCICMACSALQPMIHFLQNGRPFCTWDQQLWICTEPLLLW